MEQINSPPNDGISSLSFSPKANYLVATSWDNQVMPLACRILVFYFFIVSFLDGMGKLRTGVLFRVLFAVSAVVFSSLATPGTAKKTRNKTLVKCGLSEVYIALG